MAAANQQAISLLSKLIELEPTNERNFYKVRWMWLVLVPRMTRD